MDLKKLIEDNRIMSGLKKEMFDKGYNKSLNELEARSLRKTIDRLNEIKLSGESIDEAINSLTRDLLTLEKPLDLKREDRQSVCPSTGRFVPYYLT